MFLHTVFFWLKPTLSVSQLADFEKGVTSLRSIESVGTFFVGKPAPTRRPVIDHTYSYKLSLSFADQKNQDAYQIDSIHLLFVKQCSQYWDKVLVYDAEEI